MSRPDAFALVVLANLAGCVAELADTSSTEQAGTNMQGTNMQGTNMQGFRLDGATLSSHHLSNVRVENGELVAERNHHTLRGAGLVGAHFDAQAENPTTSPPTTIVVEYRITAVEAENPAYDPTGTGNTFLYTLEQRVQDNGSWQPACSADSDGRRVAIPLAATWNAHGDRVEDATLFTFACTTGVIAKCYRWGYRPWASGYGDLATMHWTCTRLARADYCGNGVPHTQDGTWVNVWDTLPSPGPIQSHGSTPLGMVFEAGWSTDGAVCLSRTRWLSNEIQQITTGCPDRLIPPGLGETACDTANEALGYGPSAMMFDESYLNLF